VSKSQESPWWRARTSAGARIVIGAILLLACSGPVATPSHTPAPSPAAHTAPSPSEATSSPSDAAEPATPAVPVADSPPHGYATRLQIPFLQVDLPVIAGLMNSEGNPEFPLCDVAQFLPFYRQPGMTGTTYLYAHARQGMLLSMLQQSKVDGGAAMVGEEIVVYTSDGWRHTYAITQVKPHATDYAIADEIAPGEERLIVQTSEGRVGDPFKLQVAAAPVSSEMGDPSEAAPAPSPRDCSPAG
jgi:hypothetical protein